MGRCFVNKKFTEMSEDSDSNKRMTPWFKRPEKSLRAYRAQAENDALSGVKRREELIKDLESHGIKKTSLLFFDIDGFKDVNDRFGDSYGDEIVKIFGQRLKGKFSDVYRKGGDEFLVVLNDVVLDDAVKRAKEFGQYMEENPMVSEDKTKFEKTVSIGAAYGNNYENVDDFIKAAGVALHEAKDAGRNQLKVAE